MRIRNKYSLIRFGSPTSAAPHNLNWRPWPLQLPFLITFITLCIILSVVIELLLRSCSATGCAVIGPPSRSHIPAATSFAYNYLPIILSVAFGLLWAVAHHDYMRMEPWFQLSKDGGATAKDSLLLQYPYMFPLLVPVKAGKRRHYTVLLSSLIILLITLFLTPVTSGIFDDALLTKPLNTTITVPVLPYNASTAILTAGFSYIAYTHAWLNGSLPPFVTDSYALSPFVAPDLDVTNERWTGDGALYEAELKCEEAVKTPITANGIGTIGWKLTGAAAGVHFNLWDRGIIRADDPKLLAKLMETVPEFQPVPDFQHLENIFQINTAWSSLTFADEDAWGPNTYLYIWGSTADPSWPSTPGTSALPKDWTGIFCKPSYAMVAVNAVVVMPGGKIKNITRLPEEPISLNGYRPLATFFQRLNDAIIVGMDDKYVNGDSQVVGFGYSPMEMPNVDAQLRRRFGDAWGDTAPRDGAAFVRSNSTVYIPNVASLSAFALYSRMNETLGLMLEPQEMAETYSRAFKMLFAVAWSQELLDPDSGVEGSVMRERRMRGYRMNTVWARGAQVGFGVVAVLALGLVVGTWGRRCRLDGEPNSLAVGLGLLGRSPEVVEDMEWAEFRGIEELKEVMEESGRRYRLEVTGGEGPRIVVVGGTEVEFEVPEGAEVYKVEPTWPLSSWSGVLFVLFFGVVLALLLLLFGYGKANNGLPTLASPGSFGFKILFSYLPTVLGLAAEPLLVTAGSYYCMLGPYKALHRGSAHSDNSLALDYDKSPPHFQLLRSVRAGDIAVGGLSVAILLSSVLAVALGGLFSTVTAQFDVELPVTSMSVPMIDGAFTVPAGEMYHTLSANLSKNIQPPTWTTPDYYIIPFNTSFSPSTSELITASASTLGIGASISCSLVPDSKINQTCSFSNDEIYTNCPASFLLNDTTLSEHLAVDDPCWAHEPVWLSTSDGPDTTYDWLDPSNDYFARSVDCPNTFFALWVERPADPNPRSSTLLYQDHIEALVLRCTTAETAVQLTATADASNNVFSISNVSPLSPEAISNLYPPNIEDHQKLAPTFLDVIRTGIRTVPGIGVPHDIKWFNYLLANIHNSTIPRGGPNVTHIPETAGLPEAFEDVFRRLFAINLRLYSSDILSFPATPEASTATSRVIRERVQVSTPMFIIACVILSYTILLVFFLYWGPEAGRQCGIAHEPTSLAAMWAMLYSSTAKEMCAALRGNGPKERARRLKEMGQRYGYRSFMGVDGGRHVGVFCEEKEDIDQP